MDNDRGSEESIDPSEFPVERGVRLYRVMNSRSGNQGRGAGADPTMIWPSELEPDEVPAVERLTRSQFSEEFGGLLDCAPAALLPR